MKNVFILLLACIFLLLCVLLNDARNAAGKAQVVKRVGVKESSQVRLVKEKLGVAAQ